MNDAVFSAWWAREGKRLCQSVLIATENQTVEQKMKQVFESGYDAGCRLTYGEYMAEQVSA